jgi:hypothetical protein
MCTNYFAETSPFSISTRCESEDNRPARQSTVAVTAPTTRWLGDR